MSGLRRKLDVTLLNSGHTFGHEFRRFVLFQLLDLVHRQTIDRLVERYGAESHVRHFGCRQQLIAMAFAQLTWRAGLRDIADCLNARPTARFHLGFREPVAKSTLADANEQRDWRLWEDLAKNLMRKARRLYAGEELGLTLITAQIKTLERDRSRAAKRIIPSPSDSSKSPASARSRPCASS